MTWLKTTEMFILEMENDIMKIDVLFFVYKDSGINSPSSAFELMAGLGWTVYTLVEGVSSLGSYIQGVLPMQWNRAEPSGWHGLGAGDPGNLSWMSMTNTMY